MSNILYVYGTLRPGDQEPVKVPGILFDVGGRFPAIRLTYDRFQSFVLCEKIEVKDWDAVDRYEGYFPDDPASSLYIRRPYLDGYIYEFNQNTENLKLVESGDWLEYKKQRKGVAHEHFSQ